MKGLHLKAVNKFEETLHKLENFANDHVEETEIDEELNEEIAVEAKTLTPREKLKKKIMRKEANQTNVFTPGILSKFKQECSIYESMPDADSSTNRLLWWKMHSSTFRQ